MLCSNFVKFGRQEISKVVHYLAEKKTKFCNSVIKGNCRIVLSLLVLTQYIFSIKLQLLLLHPFNGLFSRTTWVSQHQKGKPFWILLEQEMMGWQWHQLVICKSFAPRSRQITMPVPHHSVFYRPDALPAAHPTASKHKRQKLRF